MDEQNHFLGKSDNLNSISRSYSGRTKLMPKCYPLISIYVPTIIPRKHTHKGGGEREEVRKEREKEEERKKGGEEEEI